MFKKLLFVILLFQTFNANASSFMECIYRVKFIEKKQDSLLFEMQSNHSENPLCKSSKKFFKVFKKDLKSSLKSIKPGTLVFLKEWTYSAMGAKGVVNALEYTVLESLPK